MKTQIRAEIQQGEIFYHNIEDYRDFIKKNEGKKLVATFDSNRQRTLSQNNYYWVICTIAAIHEVRKKEIIHARNKLLYFLPEIHPDLAIHEDKLSEMSDRELLDMGSFLSSIEKNTKAFAQMVDKFRADMAIKGCYLPTPKEFKKMSETEIRKIYDTYHNLFAGK